MYHTFTSQVNIVQDAKKKKSIKLTTDVTSSNGLSPLTISNSTSPKLHTSLDRVYTLPRNRSGDMYRVVPTTV